MTSAHPPHLTSDILNLPGIAHAFFSREGGVSEAPYSSLNTGPGSSDKPAAIAENRQRCAALLGIEPAHLLTGYQTHSPNVMVVDGPWADGPVCHVL